MKNFPISRRRHATCEVLDTPHNCGANTVYDAFAVGTSVVTRTGRYQRCRWAAAAYAGIALTGLAATSAAEYVALTVRVAG